MDKRGACTHTLGNARARRSSDARDEPLLSPRKANFALTFPDLWRFPKYLVKSVYHGQEFQPASAYEKVVHGLPSLSSPSPGRRPGYPWCAARRSLPQENLVSRKSFPPQQTDARGAWNVVNHGQDSDRVSSPLPPLRYSARFSNRPRFIKNCTVHAFFSMSWFRFRNRVERECLKNAGSPLAKEGEKEGGLYCNPWKDRVNLVEIRFLFFPFCPFRLLFGSSNIFELFIQFWYRINCGSDILR